MKIIIAGSRNFNNFELLRDKCNKILLHQDWSKVEIVSGTARGADQLGEKYAELNDVPVKKFPANWDKFGKSAGYIRNKEMAKYADACICFWDGKSRGTKHMIDISKEMGLKLRIILTC